MKKHDNRYESDWIITAISSGAEGAAVYKLHGNIDDLKQTILSLQIQTASEMRTAMSTAVKSLTT